LGPSEALAVTEDGQVLGNGWIWRNGVRVSLGLKGSGTAINRKGHVVGSYLTGEWYNAGLAIVPVQHAFVWQDEKMTDLGTFGGLNSYASSINNSDQVVGVADSSQGRQTFLWQNGVKTPLASLVSATSGWKLESVNRILDDGRVLGIGSFQNGRHIYQLTPQPDGFYTVTDLGQLTGTESTLSLSKFNDLGWATGLSDFGWSNVGGMADIQAVLWKAGTMTALGNLGSPASYGLGLNNRGDVVGESNSQSYRAFLWRGGMIYDLNSQIPSDSGWVLVDADAINDAGQIVGHGMIEGVHRAFLLDPTDDLSKRFRLTLRPAPISTERGLHLEVGNVPAGQITLEASSDLGHWTAFATTNLNTNGTWTIAVDGAEKSVLFFRAIVKP